ncbi:unnamed protein product [Camellia sinensis]
MPKISSIVSEVFVDFADEDHGDDCHGGSVGDSEAVEEVGLEAESTQLLVDLGATAVDEDDADADAGEEDEVGDDGGLEGRGFHGGVMLPTVPELMKHQKLAWKSKVMMIGLHQKR